MNSVNTARLSGWCGSRGTRYGRGSASVSLDCGVLGTGSFLCPSARREPRLTFGAFRPVFSLSFALEPLDVLNFGAWAM
jgi:hypothetical protein